MAGKVDEEHENAPLAHRVQERYGDRVQRVLGGEAARGAVMPR